MTQKIDQYVDLILLDPGRKLGVGPGLDLEPVFGSLARQACLIVEEAAARVDEAFELFTVCLLYTSPSPRD